MFIPAWLIKFRNRFTEADRAKVWAFTLVVNSIEDNRQWVVSIPEKKMKITYGYIQKKNAIETLLHISSKLILLTYDYFFRFYCNLVLT